MSIPARVGFESLKRLEEENGGLPETALVRTGSGGQHYYFRVPPGRSIGNAVGLRPGLDIRGDGGLVVVPPSVHPYTNREYEWLRHPKHGIAQAPAWLLEELQAPCKVRSVGKDARPTKKPKPASRPPGSLTTKP